MAAAEQSFFATPFAGPGGRLIASPFQFVGDDDTFLRIVSVSSVPGVVVAVQGRRIDSQGVLRLITETHAPLSTRTTKTQDYKLGAGALLNLTLFAQAGAPLVGQCYVMAQLMRSTGTTAIVLGTLLGGYITATQALGFPGSPVVSSLEAEPAIRAIIGTAVPANSELLETCPTGARWEVLSWAATLNTDATAGNREYLLAYRVGGLPFGFFLPLTAIPPSRAEFSGWCPNYPGNTSTTFQADINALPQRLILRASDSIGTLTNFISAADNWTPPRYTVREWLEVV